MGTKGYEAHRAHVDGAHDVVAEVGRRDDDDWQSGITASQLREQVEAVFVAELDIEEREIEIGPRSERITRGLRAGHRDDLDMFGELLHDRSHGVKDQGVVADHAHVHEPSEVRVSAPVAALAQNALDPAWGE